MKPSLPSLTAYIAREDALEGAESAVEQIRSDVDKGRTFVRTRFRCSNIILAIHVLPSTMPQIRVRGSEKGRWDMTVSRGRFDF
jgi:hypothetical protein